MNATDRRFGVRHPNALVAVVALSLLSPGPALAQGYMDVPGSHIGSSGDPGDPGASAGNLAYTGFDAGALALIGAGLLGVGFALRRATREDVGAER
ncbi:MAG: hypothetical protein QOG62_1323 [Thermoleophilaceae bacterium]|jgi:hypothetical protein|nr:hypothetical protein [Thermoleophilaceae bacterium]